QAAVLADLGLSADSPDAAVLAEIATTGTERVRELVVTLNRLEAAGVVDPAAAAEQITLVRRMFDAGLFSDSASVNAALQNEFDRVNAENVVVRRPGNRLLVAYDTTAPVGIVWADPANPPDDPSDDRPDTFLLRLGSRALLFVLANLESTIV